MKNQSKKPDIDTQNYISLIKEIQRSMFTHLLLYINKQTYFSSTFFQ